MVERLRDIVGKLRRIGRKRLAFVRRDRPRVRYAPVLSTYSYRPLRLSPRSPRATRICTRPAVGRWIHFGIGATALVILVTVIVGLTRQRQAVSASVANAPVPPAISGENPWQRVEDYPVRRQFAVDQEHLVLISKERRQLALFRRVQTFPVAVGMNPGDKRRVGDNRTPVTKPGQLFPLIKKRVTPSASQFGSRYLELSTPPWRGIAIHGTNEPASIGKAASHGCIRLWNPHVEWLFNRLHVGDPVIITN